MQQKWDDIDNLILDAMEDIQPSYDYNNRLMNKIHEKNTSIKTYNVPAFSLILAGILIMFVFTNDMQYMLLEAKFKIKTEVISVQKEISNINILKNVFGE